MPPLPLPENASLEHLKNQAKLVQQLVRDGDPGGLDLVREFHPRLGRAVAGQPELTGFRRTDAQLVVARLYGFPSWARLREQLDVVGIHARPDTGDVDPDDPVERFVALAAVSYGDDDARARLIEAERILAATPDLATASVAAAAVTGNHRLLGRWLDDDPDLVDRSCGPNRWPPLLYCAYSRLPADGERSTLTAARLLLERGADPDAGFLWRGLVPPFTALTGAFGRGEQDQPPHPDGLALARALLEAGADPNDGQALYNNGLAGSAVDRTDHLELLVEFGLGRGGDGPWYRRFGGRLTSPEELVYDELEVAAVRNLPRRMRFLVGLGLDLERGVGRSGLPPARLAADRGHTEILAVLAGTDR